MDLQITEEILRQIAPAAPKNAGAFLPYFNQAFALYEINTPARIACFLAQAAHESESFRYTKELGSGKEYEGRTELGNTVPGDGVKYKGRGLFEITGKYNYMNCSENLFKDKYYLLQHPDQLETPQYAVLSAGWFWELRKLNDICDLSENWTTKHNGKTYNMFEWLTYHINGGLNGLADRLAYYERAKKAIASWSQNDL
jgi:putative chitinase